MQWRLTAEKVNRFLGYLLFPLRCVLVGFIAIVGGISWLLINNYRPNDSFSMQLAVTDALLFYSGISVEIPNDSGWLGYGNLYRHNQFVTIFNHSHPLDLLVIQTAMRRPLTGLVNQSYLTSNFSHFLVRNLGLKGVDQRIWCEVVENLIIKHLQNDTVNCLVLSPVCVRSRGGLILDHPTQSKQVLPTFDQGIFATRKNVLPMVVRYVASKNSQFGQPETLERPPRLWKLLLGCLLDGHIVANVNFLNLETCYQYLPTSLDGDILEFRNRVHQLMSNKYLELPPEKPNRIISPPVVRYVWDGFWIFLGMLCSPLGDLVTAPTWPRLVYQVGSPKNTQVTIVVLFITCVIDRSNVNVSAPGSDYFGEGWLASYLFKKNENVISILRYDLYPSQECQSFSRLLLRPHPR